MRCMYAGDTTPVPITLIEPGTGSGTYQVNCGTDDPSNPAVPVPAG